MCGILLICLLNVKKPTLGDRSDRRGGHFERYMREERGNCWLNVDLGFRVVRNYRYCFGWCECGAGGWLLMVVGTFLVGLSFSGPGCQHARTIFSPSKDINSQSGIRAQSDK